MTFGKRTGRLIYVVMALTFDVHSPIGVAGSAARHFAECFRGFPASVFDGSLTNLNFAWGICFCG